MSDDFYRGVAAALTVVAQYDHEVIFDEIVRACGPRRLVDIAASDGVLKLSGFTRYGYLKSLKGAKRRG
jgi:hypothetical protein